MVDPVTQCPTCGMTVFQSSDSISPACSTHAPETAGLMNEHSVLKTICGTVQWAARQADNPAFRDIAFDPQTGTFRVTVDLPTDSPEVYEITARRVR
jgi:hypothetical protein